MEEEKNKKEVDIFRDTNVRYLGYANEVGESFRHTVPTSLVRYSYYLAFAYVLADTADKGWKSLRKDGVSKKILVETSDALLWQTLASIVIPGFTINRICAFTHKQLLRAQKLPPVARKPLTIAAGLLSIPFVVGPIDAASTMLMDVTYRRYFG